MDEEKRIKNLDIDIRDFGLLLLKKAVFIIIAIIIGVSVALITTYSKKQTYRAGTLLYTNNYRSTAQDLVKYITSSDITASRSLIDVYAIIIKTRETLNDSFFEELNSDPEISRSYTFTEVKSMITVGAKNKTEILEINVVGENPHDIIIIANAVSNAAKTRIESVIQGTNIEIVEDAWGSYIISKNILRNCIIGGVIGFVAMAFILFLYYIINNDIDSEEWISKCFENKIPILAVVPDSVTTNKKRYGYRSYRHYKKYGDYEDKNKENK